MNDRMSDAEFRRLILLSVDKAKTPNKEDTPKVEINRPVAMPINMDKPPISDTDFFAPANLVLEAFKAARARRPHDSRVLKGGLAVLAERPAFHAVHSEYTAQEIVDAFPSISSRRVEIAVHEARSEFSRKKRLTP